MKMFSFIRTVRPHQWSKNLLLLFPPFFAGKLFGLSLVENLIPPVFAFSLAASCGYIINDLRDIETDQNHVHKKNRVIASGGMPPSVAVILAICLYVAAMLIASSVSRTFQGLLIVYLIVSAMYTFFFKDKAIIDIFFITFGFVIRVFAGGEAFRVTVSSWLFLTVFMVSLLLATGKRLSELILLGEDAYKHRKSLNHYSPSFLEGILWFSGSSALVTYALYALEHKSGIFYTVPLAAFGVLRYIYIVKEGKGDPTDALLKDAQIMGTGLLWAIMIGIMIYKPV